MKKLLLFSIFITVYFSCHSQISFEQGYFVNNSDQKINCLIKNIDWKNNPTEFEYKLSQKTELKKVTIDNVKEFGISNESKYVRYITNIDRSSDLIDELSDIKSPIFKEEQLFLKVLVEGEANLYRYKDGHLIRYFYSKDKFTEVKQLIYKRYKNSDDYGHDRIGLNNGFRIQLFTDLKCQDISIKDVKNIVYDKSELIIFFVKYNKCNDAEFTNFEEKQKRDFFNLSIRPGLNSSSLKIENGTAHSLNANFGNKLAYRIGVEAEFILPFNKNKWAILIEPTYQYFKSETERIYNPNTIFERIKYIEVNYNSIELPLGLRYYSFLNNDSRIFINSSVIFDFSGNSTIDYDFESGLILELNTSFNLAFGLGYQYKNKYSLEFRYLTSREVLGTYAYWSSSYNTSSVIFGYSLF